MPTTEVRPLAVEFDFIDVVAAAILSDNKDAVLLTLRQATQHQGGLWEFPGGKVEPGEDQREALCRELHEELDIDVHEAEALMTIEHRYTDKAVRLHVYSVTEFGGEAKGMENQHMQWVELSKLSSVAFPEANKPIVERLLAVFI